MKRKVWIRAFVFALSLVLIGNVCNVSAFAQENKNDIKLITWMWTDELGEMGRHYMETHPDGYTIEHVVVPFDSYQTALNNAIQSKSEDAPDIFAGEAGFFKQYIDSNLCIPLSEVGITEADTDASGIYKYMLELGTDADGELKGLGFQTVAGVCYYRTSYAKQYLGVETPEEFKELIKDWDKFLVTAKTLFDASNGFVRMVGGMGDITAPFRIGQRTMNYVEDDRLNVEPFVEEYMEYTKTLINSDLTCDNSARQSGSWYAEANDAIEEYSFLCTFGAPWLLAYVLQPNIGDEPGESTYGDWSICESPYSFFNGGTWFMISSSSKNKEAAAEYLRYLTLDTSTEGNLYWWLTEKGDATSSQIVNEMVVDGYANGFVGGQNSLLYFMNAAEAYDQIPCYSNYDATIEGIMDDEALAYTEGKVTLEEAMENYINRVADELGVFVD